MHLASCWLVKSNIRNTALVRRPSASLTCTTHVAYPDVQDPDLLHACVRRTLGSKHSASQCMQVNHPM
jgi:hypothetical protein